MKAIARVATLGLLSVGLAGFGCSSDNEDIVKAQQKLNAGAPAAAATTPAPKNQQEYFQQRQKSQPYSKDSGYPGAK